AAGVGSCGCCANRAHGGSTHDDGWVDDTTPACLRPTRSCLTAPSSRVPGAPHELLDSRIARSRQTTALAVGTVMSRTHATPQNTRPLPGGNGLITICSPDGFEPSLPP